MDINQIGQGMSSREETSEARRGARMAQRRALEQMGPLVVEAD